MNDRVIGGSIFDWYPEKGWDLIYRAGLQSALRNLAVSSEGAGLPVQLFLNSKIIGLVVTKATLELADSRLFTGDLVLGADGVHVCDIFLPHVTRSYELTP